MNIALDPNMEYRAYQMAVLLSEYLDVGELQKFSLAWAGQPTLTTELLPPSTDTQSTFVTPVMSSIREL